MAELTLPLVARLRRDRYADAVTSVFTVGVLAAWIAGDPDGFDMIGGAAVLATIVAILIHRVTGHCRVTWFDDHVEVRNPFLTTDIPRGEIVEMASGQVTRGTGCHVVLRDGRHIACAALPDHAGRLSVQYLARPDAPRGSVRDRISLCWYDTVWLVACGAFLAVAASF